jgi:hypothetical protein
MLVPALAVAALVAGIIMIAQREWALTHVAFGWFAYAPESKSVLVPGLGFDWGPVGVAFVAAGLGVLTVLGGLRLARTRGEPRRAVGTRLLRTSPLLVGGAAALVAAGAFIRWDATRLLIGWSDMGPRPSGTFALVATQRQFDMAVAEYWHGPLVVGVALLLVGVAAVGFGVGQLAAIPRGSDSAKRPPHTA